MSYVFLCNAICVVLSIGRGAEKEHKMFHGCFQSPLCGFHCGPYLRVKGIKITVRKSPFN